MVCVGPSHLNFLSVLQELLGDECAIQDLFDLAFGTSSGRLRPVQSFKANLLAGGLIVLCLFVRQWGVEQCVRVFDTITRQFFCSQSRKGHGFLASLRHLASCWLSDGIYDVEALEKVLKDVFGAYERLFGTVQVNQRAKIAVTATTISDASPFVFSNYNGINARRRDCGILHTICPVHGLTLYA